MGENILGKTLTKSLAIPNWAEFTDTITKLFNDIKRDVHDGECATYIPILASQVCY